MFIRLCVLKQVRKKALFPTPGVHKKALFPTSEVRILCIWVLAPGVLARSYFYVFLLNILFSIDTTKFLLVSYYVAYLPINKLTLKYNLIPKVTEEYPGSWNFLYIHYNSIFSLSPLKVFMQNFIYTFYIFTIFYISAKLYISAIFLFLSSH